MSTDRANSTVTPLVSGRLANDTSPTSMSTSMYAQLFEVEGHTVSPPPSKQALGTVSLHIAWFQKKESEPVRSMTPLWSPEAL